MTTFLRQLLRHSHRSKSFVLHYTRNNQIQASSSGTRKTIPSSFAQNDEYLTEKFKTNLKPSDLNKHLELLKSDAINYNRVNYKNLLGFINAAVKDHLSQSEGIFLLNCCTMLPDTNPLQVSQLIETIWNDGIVRCGQPTKEHIISLLRAYRVVGRTINDFNAFIAQYECEGDLELYEEFLYLTCENGSISEEILKVLSDFKNRGFPLTERLFNALILGHSKNRNVENCEKVLLTMLSVHLKPTSETYMQLVRAYIENGDESKATNVLNDHRGTFSQEQLFTVIKTAAVNNATNLVNKTIEFLSDDTLHNKQVVPALRNICIELIHMDKSDVAFSIIEKLPLIRLSETEDKDKFGIFFIIEMIRRNEDWTKIIDISKKLVDSGRNPRAVHCCCEIMLRMNSPNALDCLKILKNIEPLRCHYFWPLFINQFQSNGETGILNVLQEMKTLEVPVDEDTLIHYVLAKLPITLKNTKEGIRILANNGVPIGILLTPLLCRLLQQFKLNDALETLKQHKVKIDTNVLSWPLIVNARNFHENSLFATFAELVQILNARNEKGPSDLAGEILVEILTRSSKPLNTSIFVAILEQFNAIGIKIPTTTFDQLIGHLHKHLPLDVRKKSTGLLRKMLDKTIETSLMEQLGSIKHPKDMSLEELECHLIELESKNLNTRGILRRLLQLSVRAGKLDRSLEINKMCIAKNVESSPGMLASVLDLMIRTKNLTEAETTLKKLKKLYPAFAIDEFKIIDLASLMIENDRMDDAKIVLDERAVSKILGGTSSLKNIWTLLSNVAALSHKVGAPTNKSKEFLDFLIQRGYCTNHNTLFGPIIREYLLKNELNDAMNEFEIIANSHKKTPMHFELMTTLINILNSRQENQKLSAAEAKEMLAKVVKIVSSIHGSANANVSLVVAFAKAGTETQLRKMLIDPTLELNADMVVKQCEYLSSVGAEKTLFKLVKCSRGLGRVSMVFKEQELYDLLLNEYTRNNNYAAALALFERVVQDEESRYSNNFTRKVADLFDKNNLELPTTVQMQLRRT